MLVCRIIQDDGVFEVVHTHVPINKDDESRLKGFQGKYKDAWILSLTLTSEELTPRGWKILRIEITDQRQ